MFKPTFQFSIYCTYILYLYKSALKNQSCWISYHDFNIEARKPGTKPSLRKICPSSSVLSIKSPVHVTVLLHVHVYLFFYVTLHLNHVWERQAVYEKYRNISYRASLLFFKNRSVQNPVRGKPRVTIWSHI